MKSSHIAVVFLFVSFFLASAPSGARAVSDEAGFRGTNWGADLSGRPDMSRISCEDAFCSYSKAGEDLHVDDAIITSVIYRTFNDRFVEVVIDAPVETRQGSSAGFESENYLAMKKDCHDRFGKTSFAATFETIRAEQYRWEYTGVRKILRVNLNKNNMQLVITAHDLLEDLKEAPAEKQDKAVEDVRTSQPNDAHVVENILTPQAKDVHAVENVSKPQPEAVPAGETLLPATDVAGDAPSGDGEKRGFGGLKKAAKALRWLFVNDAPATGDEPPVNPH